MAKKTLPQIALLFQDLNQQMKDLEAQLITSQQSCYQLRVLLHNIMLEVIQDYKSLLH